jgi:uncharacterized membrane protein
VRDNEASPSPLPDHVESTVQAIARLHAEHHLEASAAYHLIDRLTSIVGSPAFLALLPLFVAGWIGVNLSLPLNGYAAFDPPPFVWLVGLLALLSVGMASLILTSQRRADRLANRRDQLNLEVSIMGEQKAAKIISLLEELRRDSPDIRNRRDDEANAMATPAEPKVVLDALEATHEQLIENEDDV